MLASGAFATFVFTKSALQVIIQANQEELSRQTMDKVDRLLFGYYVSIQNIGEEEHIERTLGGELTDLRVIERRIKELPFLSGPWDQLKIVNLDKVIVVSNTQQRAGRGFVENSPSNLAALKAAFAGHVYYSDFIAADGELDRPTMIFAAPIRDQEKSGNPIVGAVIGHIAWPVISEILKNLSSTTEFDLYNHEGVLIATNQETEPNLFHKNEEVTKVIQNPKNSSEVSIELENHFEALITQTTSAGYLSYKGNGWVLFAETPTAIAFAPAKKTAWIIVSVLIPIISLVMVTILYLLNRLIVQPVVKLTKITDVIANGDLAKRAEVKAQDEIGDLTTSFNLMADKIMNSYSDVKKAKDKIVTLVESISDGVIAIDINWNIIEWNSAAETISGWSKREVLGKPFRDHIHFIRERDRSENIIFIQEAMLYGKAKSMENHTILVRKDKSEISIGDSAAPIFDENKKVIGVIIVFRDMTKELESQSLKTDFKYAAHQMRTPVTKVLWDIEVAIDSKDEKERQELLTDAHDSARSISKMSDQLLAVAEIEQNVVVPRHEAVDAAEIIGEILRELKPNADKEKIRLSFVNNIDDSKIETDKILVKRFLSELVDNGIKYNKENGEVLIAMTEDGSQVLFEIKDTGIGIIENQHPLIFTKFFRGANYDTSKIPGAGMGLFISRSYVNLLNGKIWFRSEVGKGTSFFVLLPKLRQ